MLQRAVRLLASALAAGSLAAAPLVLFVGGGSAGAQIACSSGSGGSGCAG